MQGVIIEKDEGYREDTSLEKLAKLPPVFQKTEFSLQETVPQLSDGAAALIVASARKSIELGIKPLAKIIDYATGGTRPEDIMEAPYSYGQKTFRGRRALR